MSEVGRLNGKVAIVTGAAGGIGKAICERFLAEGAKVMMVDWSEENLKNVYEKFSAKYHSKVAMIQCDVAKENSASEVIVAANNQFGQNCDILVNNAAVMPVSPIVETTTASFNQVLDVNLTGVFNFTKEFLLRLELGKNNDVSTASIVNVASVMGVKGMENCAAYAASKAGVIAFTKTTCIEVGRFGVRCNAVMPGPIETPMLQLVDSKTIEGFKQMVPLGRCGRPIEVANACLFLASDESSYVNGAELCVTGGY